MKQAQERAEIENKYILKLFIVIAETEELIIKNYYFYPNEDLYERQKDFVKCSEMI